MSHDLFLQGAPMTQNHSLTFSNLLFAHSAASMLSPINGVIRLAWVSRILTVNRDFVSSDGQRGLLPVNLAVGAPIGVYR